MTPMSHAQSSGGDYAPLLVGGMLKSDVDRALGKEATESGFRKFVDTVGRRPPRKTSVIHKVRSRLAPVDAARGGLQQHARGTRKGSDNRSPDLGTHGGKTDQRHLALMLCTQPTLGSGSREVD